MEHARRHCTCNDAWDHWNCTTDQTEAVRCVDGNVEIDHCTNGCDVMPIGQDDVCHVADARLGRLGLQRERDRSIPSIQGHSGGNGKAGGGCNSGGSPPLWLGLLVLLVKRRRVV